MQSVGLWQIDPLKEQFGRYAAQLEALGFGTGSVHAFALHLV